MTLANDTSSPPRRVGAAIPQAQQELCRPMRDVAAVVSIRVRPLEQPAKHIGVDRAQLAALKAPDFATQKLDLITQGGGLCLFRGNEAAPAAKCELRKVVDRRAAL